MPFVVTKVKFGNISLKMALATMLINALHPALEYGKETLDSVSVDFAATIFTSSVTYKMVFCKVFVKMCVCQVYNRLPF